jgi:D-alanyl-lipoteichoic acid acyltransferase DltB (MBOAT superfamily)
MLFNSPEFGIFLIIVFVFYWSVGKRNLKTRNILLLLSSYFFYGWWDWRFLGLLVGISISNFFIGRKINNSSEERKTKNWLYTGIFLNLAVLVFFKYFNFFMDGLIDVASALGVNLTMNAIQIILPLGISFYVFLSLSYLIDIYNRTLTEKYNITDVLLSLGFFPIILAGPIQRPSMLLPQIKMRKEFNPDLAVDGLRQILWGLFVKIAVADNLAVHVNEVFPNYSEYSGSTLFVVNVYYAIQIYADFSGYSNIAIGVAKLFGFRLSKNFAYPYFSRNISEFWKRWHITLTTWFRDYLFMPLSTSLSGKTKTQRILNLKTPSFIYIIASIITWALTGLWHGANYTFIVWGIINGIFLIMFNLQNQPRKKLLKRIGISNGNFLIITLESTFTFIIIMVSWIFFRADNLNHAFNYIKSICSKSFFTQPEYFSTKLLFIIPFFIIFEWVQRKKEHALQIQNIKHRSIRWGIYLLISFIVLMFGGGAQKFIYFQF